MTRLSLALFIFSFLNISSVYSQIEDFMINPRWSFYSDNFLDAVSSGKGNTGIGSTGNISAIQINPASMKISGEYQIDAQYTYKANQRWLPELSINDLYLEQNLFSGSAGFGRKINKHLQAGFLYSNPKSFTFNVGKIIVTDEFGNEIGSFDGYDKYVIHSFSIPLVYEFDNLRFGLNFNYSLHRRYFKFNEDDIAVGKFDRFNISAGVLVSPTEDFSVGATFTPQVKGKVKMISNTFTEENEEAIIPAQLGMGFEYSLSNGIVKLSGDYTFKNFSASRGLEDIHQGHLGLEYKAGKKWIFRTGVFNLPDVRILSLNNINKEFSYNQFFLTAGATYIMKKARISIAIMDSHLYAGDLRNTFVNGGFTYDF